jgi:hypothetical protein
MIPDKAFKALQHSHKGYVKHLNGQILEKGYKPDYVLKKRDNYIILESENSSSRKTFVGGMIKAAHFLQGERKGKLVFIIVLKKNTTAYSIAKHLRPYLKMVRGRTNLKEVFVVESSSYYCNNSLLALDCNDFKKCAYKV